MCFNKNLKLLHCFEVHWLMKECIRLGVNKPNMERVSAIWTKIVIQSHCLAGKGLMMWNLSGMACMSIPYALSACCHHIFYFIIIIIIIVLYYLYVLRNNFLAHKMHKCIEQCHSNWTLQISLQSKIWNQCNKYKN